MPRTTQTYEIVIASPSDVPEERDIVESVVSEWNHAHSGSRGVTLLPLRWETDVYPALGDSAQAEINRQMVDHADMMIAMFWTRLGTPTAKAQSGTVEEISEMRLKNSRPVMLYFSDRPINPSKIDGPQLQRVIDFKSSMLKSGVVGSYSDLQEFKEKLRLNLDQQMNSLIGVTIPAPFDAEQIKLLISRNDRGVRLVDNLMKTGLTDIEAWDMAYSQMPPMSVFQNARREIMISGLTCDDIVERFGRDLKEKADAGVSVKLLMLRPDILAVPGGYGSEFSDARREDLHHNSQRTLRRLAEEGWIDSFAVRFFPELPPFIAIMIDGNVDGLGERSPSATIRIHPRAMYSKGNSGIVLQLHAGSNSMFHYYAEDLRRQWSKATPQLTSAAAGGPAA